MSDRVLTQPTFLALSMMVAELALKAHRERCERCKTETCLDGQRLASEAGKHEGRGA